MPADQPFEPAVKASVAGLTVSIAAQSTSQSTSLDVPSANDSSILVTCVGPAGVVAYMRLSSEDPPTATVTDTPIPCAPTGTVRLYANPSALGKCGIAVIVTVTASPVTLWFTPGFGGVV